MRVRQVTSVRELNIIANEDNVREAINPNVNFVDLAWVLANKNNLVLKCDGVDGCCIFVAAKDGEFELHYFMDTHKPQRAIRAIIDWVFTRTQCSALFGYTPVDNLPARIVNRWLGAGAIGDKIDGAGRKCVIYKLSREAWAAKKQKRPVAST